MRSHACYVCTFVIAGTIAAASQGTGWQCVRDEAARVVNKVVTSIVKLWVKDPYVMKRICPWPESGRCSGQIAPPWSRNLGPPALAVVHPTVEV